MPLRGHPAEWALGVGKAWRQDWLPQPRDCASAAAGGCNTQGAALAVPNLCPSGERGGRGDGGAPQATFPAGLNSCPEVWLRKKTQNLPTIFTSSRLNPLNQLGRLCVYVIYKRLLRAPTKENTLILIAVDTEGKNTEV